jgi:hypothetical protein
MVEWCVVLNTMSMPHRPPTDTPDRIDVIPNDDEGTVTFVAEAEQDRTDPPTRWITIASEDAIDVKASR